MRPEDLRVGTEGVAATVVSTSFLGAVRRTIVRLPGDLLLTVQHDTGDRPAAGDEVRVAATGRPVAVEAAEPGTAA